MAEMFLKQLLDPYCLAPEVMMTRQQVPTRCLVSACGSYPWGYDLNKTLLKAPVFLREAFMLQIMFNSGIATRRVTKSEVTGFPIALDTLTSGTI